MEHERETNEEIEETDKPIGRVAQLDSQHPAFNRKVLGSSPSAPTNNTIELSAEDFAAFMETLERPPEPNEKLRKLFESSSPWE